MNRDETITSVVFHKYIDFWPKGFRAPAGEHALTTFVARTEDLFCLHLTP